MNWINNIVCLFVFWKSYFTNVYLVSTPTRMIHGINLYRFQLRLGFFKSSLIWDLELLVKPYDEMCRKKLGQEADDKHNDFEHTLKTYKMLQEGVVVFYLISFIMVFEIEFLNTFDVGLGFFPSLLCVRILLTLSFSFIRNDRRCVFIVEVAISVHQPFKK